MRFFSIGIFALLAVSAIVIAAIVWLQIYLSNRQNKWVGLILPVFSFLFSVISVLGMVGFQTTGMSSVTSIEGEIIQKATGEAIRQSQRNISGIIGQSVILFILLNISTVIFLALYFICREKARKKAQLDKMNIQDLE